MGRLTKLRVSYIFICCRVGFKRLVNLKIGIDKYKKEKNSSEENTWEWVSYFIFLVLFYKYVNLTMYNGMDKNIFLL